VAIHLSGRLAERARAVAAGEIEPALARDSATVVLLRDSPRGVEAFLMRRVDSMAFAAGMFVFPGGGVDSRDADRVIAWAVPPPADWAGRLAADPPLVRALACAAIRETFEETGVLLASAADGGLLADTRDPGWEHDRRELVSRRLAFADLLDARRLALRSDLIAPWAHWITPVSEPRRFSTRFFIAALPAGQLARVAGGEADRSTWLAPHAALDALQRGQLAMMPPTAAVLAEIGTYPDVGSVLAAAAKRKIQAVRPQVAIDAEGARLLLPGDEGYDGGSDEGGAEQGEART
jgi:8-oxo-dGTP pyrophosphatase MutT (NUDIX family)